MSQIRIGVATAKIQQGLGVDHRTRRRAQPPLQNFLGIRPGYRVHRIKTHAKTIMEALAQLVKIKQAFHQLGIIIDRIDDFHGHRAQLLCAVVIEINSGCCECVIALNLLAALINGVGNLFRRRSAITDVVFDTEVFIRPARIMTGREDKSAERTVFANHTRRCRRG